jgi:hypothetical protein
VIAAEVEAVLDRDERPAGALDARDVIQRIAQRAPKAV